jgi:hypothetical protein
LENGHAGGAENYVLKIVKNDGSLISEERRTVKYESAEICGYLAAPFPGKYAVVVLEIRDTKNAFYHFFEFDVNEALFITE